MAPRRPLRQVDPRADVAEYERLLALTNNDAVRLFLLQALSGARVAAKRFEKQRSDASKEER